GGTVTTSHGLGGAGMATLGVTGRGDTAPRGAVPRPGPVIALAVKGAGLARVVQPKGWDGRFEAEAFRPALRGAFPHGTARLGCCRQGGAPATKSDSHQQRKRLSHTVS